MPLVPPGSSSDPFDLAQQFLGGNAGNRGFRAADVPSQTGFGTRSGRIPPESEAVSSRKLIHWLVPDGPMVQMYINPSQIRYNYFKQISSQRTKGGFSLQYWGENLTTLNISGTTGTSGIEGINVLNDVYRNEQLAFDPYALFLAARQRQENTTGNIFDIGSSLSEGAGPFVNSLVGAAETSFPQTAKPPPSLGSLAFTVEMFWSGVVYRGYFTNFSVTESADKIGLFDYEIGFTVTQIRGLRRNFFAWHRSPNFGPSNSDPELGPPYSYGALIEGDIGPSRPSVQEDVTEPVDTLSGFFTSLFG